LFVCYQVFTKTFTTIPGSSYYRFTVNKTFDDSGCCFREVGEEAIKKGRKTLAVWRPYIYLWKTTLLEGHKYKYKSSASLFICFI